MFRSYGNKEAGISTVEMLIAFTIIVLVISTVILVVFGNQKITVDAQTNNEALYLAQARLDKARADAQVNFSSVVSESVDGPFYDTNVTVQDISGCMKKVTVTINYTVEARPQYVSLYTFIAGFEEALALSGACVP
jgi:type II secretory pathway pseudopilin PulG